MSNARFGRITLGLDFGTTLARSQKQFYRDKFLDAQMVNDSLESGDVAPSSSVSVSLGKLTTVNALFIEVSGPLEVRLNGAGAGPVLQALPGATIDGAVSTMARLYLEGAITGITLVNASSTEPVDFTVYMAGG
jgi:hypothetical protein